MKRNNKVIIVLLVAVALIVGGYGVVAHSRADSSVLRTKAVYEWRSLQRLNLKQYSKDLQTLKQAGYNQLYLSLDDYLDISDLPDPALRSQKTAAYTAQLTNFLATANQAGFRVQALGGDPSWVDPNNGYQSTQLLQYVIDYNQDTTHRDKLSGIQFDIEPWSEPGFMDAYAAGVTQYLDAVKAIMDYDSLKQMPANFAVGFTVPLAFAEGDSAIHPVNYDGTTAYAAYHVLQLLNRRQNDYISFMDYRNTVDGSDGVLARADNLIKYAQQNTPGTSVVIAQEVNKVDPPKVTYYALGQKKLEANLQRLASTYGNSSGFEGVAVNDLQGLTKLKP